MVTNETSGETPAAPGRCCPLHYRYAPSVLSRPAEISAGTLYVIGGLYGNRPALEWIEQRAAREPDRVALVFNGDFNWFNADAAAFQAVNEAVFQHVALRGNVETEIAMPEDGAGCGCAYPEFVSEAEVARSNHIIDRLRGVAGAFPTVQARLAALPMHLVAEVGGMRIAIVHGDAESLSGWGFSREALGEPEGRAAAAAWFGAAAVRAFASSHSCLPVMQAFESESGRCVLANNGAAGMPNFSGERCGIVTRIAHTAAPDALYGTTIEGIYIEALPVRYHAARFEREFLANWPEGSAAHASYYRRIVAGPDYSLADAFRGSTSGNA